MEEKQSPSAEATYSNLRVLKATSGHQVRGRNPSWTGCCTYHSSKLWILWLQSLLSVSGLWRLNPISTKISKFEGICLVWVSNALQSSGKCLRIGMRMCVWVGGSCGYVIRPTATVDLLQILIISLINFSLFPNFTIKRSLDLLTCPLFITFILCLIFNTCCKRVPPIRVIQHIAPPSKF